MNSATGISSLVLLRRMSLDGPGHMRPTAATMTRDQIPHSMIATAQLSTVPNAKGVNTMSATRPHWTIRLLRIFMRRTARRAYACAESLPVSLDPSAFYVVDEQDNRYEAHAAATADDCSADDVVAANGTVSCSIHFTLPLVVGFDEPAGEGYGKLYLEVGGYRRVVYFKVHAAGGWGTIS